MSTREISGAESRAGDVHRCHYHCASRYNAYRSLRELTGRYFVCLRQLNLNPQTQKGKGKVV